MPPANGLYQELKQTWLKVIRAGQDAKAIYEREAQACERFYCGDQRDLYTDSFAKEIGLVSDLPSIGRQGGIDGNAARVPSFRIRDNAAGKLVQIFTPFLLSGEIVSTVKPVRPFLPPPEAFGVIGDINVPNPMPMPKDGPVALSQWAMQEQARMAYMQAAQQIEMEFNARSFSAGMLDAAINYTIRETALKGEAKLALRDALVRGLGALVSVKIDLPQGTGTMIADEYLDDGCIVIDPDAKRLKDAQWVAILCEHPVHEVARNYAAYGIVEDDLKPTLTTRAATATAFTPRDNRNMVFRYWKVYSRCGVGARLLPSKDRSDIMKQADQAFGDFCYLVISDGCDFPLNLGPGVEDMALQSGGLGPFQVALSWPVPFYFDTDDPFPFTSLWFHARKDSPWPVAHTSFGIGYLHFGCWVLGYLAEKAYRSARGAWAVDSSVAKKLTAWLRDGTDEEIFEVTKGVDNQKISDFIEYIEGAKIDLTLVDIYRFFEQKFQEITGLTDLLQANVERQMRSAQEAEVLESASRLRPEDMSATMQQFLARVLRKRAIAMRYLFTGQDLIHVLGQFGAAAWEQRIRTRDVAELFREATFQVETGRGRTLDIQSDLENINQAMQFLFPLLFQFYQTTGDPSQVNALIVAWCKARQMDPAGLLFPPLQMMPPAAQEARAQGEVEAARAEQDNKHKIEQEKAKPKPQRAA